MVQPGETIGPYHILECLGEGGMGAVFSAEDSRLARRVAIKVLSPSRLVDRVSRNRFFQEARLASSLDHANICPVHDVGVTDDDQPYIVMGLARGETLRARMDDGPLPISEVTEIARQVAQGLAEAHKNGIIHRDIKPENLTVSRSEAGALRVKILDFGIAKAEDVSLTGDGSTPGTVSYMSPEQIRSEKVGPQADVWAFGVVLYEMLAGRPPFRGKRWEQVHYSVTSQTPEPLGAFRSDTSEDLALVVRRCLAKDPLARFPSGVELLRDLEGPNLEEIEALRARIRRRTRMVGTLALFGLLLFLAVGTQPGRNLLERIAGRVTGYPSYHVLVLPFASRDSSDQALARGLTEYFTEAVAERGAFNNSIWVVPWSSVDEFGVESVDEARRMFPVDLVLRGEIGQASGELAVNVEVIETRQGTARVLHRLTLPDPQDPTFGKAAQELLNRSLRLRGANRVQEAPDSLIRNSPAYPSYVQGVGYLNDILSEKSPELAIEFFQAALAADSAFAPAYAGLCQARWEEFRREGNPEKARAAQADCETAFRLSSDDPNALVALGRTQINTGQPERAEQTLLRAVELDSNSAEGYRALGLAYDEQLDLEQAEEAYRKAISLRPEVWIYYQELGLMFQVHEEHEKAKEQFEQVIRLSPGNYFGYNDLGATLMRMGRVQEADSLFRLSLEVQPNPYAYRNLGYLSFRGQRFEFAASALEKGIAFDPGDWWTWRWLAHARHWAGEAEAAREAWQQVISLAGPRLEINPQNHDVLSALAEAHVALGQAEQGREYLDNLITQSPVEPYNEYYAGRTYEMLGSRSAAVALILRALERGYDSLMVANDPWLADLRTDPRFREYMDGR